jgi:hypothetical protein
MIDVATGSIFKSPIFTSTKNREDRYVYSAWKSFVKEKKLRFKDRVIFNAKNGNHIIEVQIIRRRNTHWWPYLMYFYLLILWWVVVCLSVSWQSSIMYWEMMNFYAYPSFIGLNTGMFFFFLLYSQNSVEEEPNDL